MKQLFNILFLNIPLNLCIGHYITMELAKIVLLYWFLLLQITNQIINHISKSDFLLQMKGDNIYSLVKPYEQFINQHHDETRSKGLPKQTNNIFTEETIDRLTQHDLNNSKSYEIVGWSELKAYRKRILKLQKLSSRKDTLSRLDQASSRDSTNRQKNHLLNKQEVISTLPIIKKNISKQRLTKRKRQTWMTNFLDVKQTKQKVKNKISKKFSHSISIKQVKHKMKQHENQWEKVFANERSNQKFPTINNSIELHRLKEQQKSILSLNQNLNNMKSSLWKQVLRKDMNMTDIYTKKQVGKIFTDMGRFTTRGNCKFKLQKRWIDSKNQQGYRFKFCQTSLPTEDLKKIISIR